MLDIEDFDAVFRGVTYTQGVVSQIQEFQHALGGRTFFERLLDVLKVKNFKIYPPKNHQQLQELHKRIISAETTLHNKHCLIFYLLKDLSPQHHEATELATGFARDVHLEKRFWTFIEGLWALDHLEFRNAVENLTHPSIIPTFPDEILLTLLKTGDRLGIAGMQKNPDDDILALAYFNCVKPPLDDQKTRIEFAKYMSTRNVTETYYWIRTRPQYEHKPLLEILIEQTLERSTWSGSVENVAYTREDKALELVSLPLSEEEEEFFEKFLTEGKGRTFIGATDTLLMRRVAMGRLADVANEASTRGRKYDGLNWEILKDGVKRGLGPRKDAEGFTM
ncbi:hypothetical protein CC86DRAFT_455059 [Ophiobolus disseminans]|uniref:ELYS-like domain-containing protein n=1 Tax=Ophiobolus disseminans TaxID=1469910 RepID=A0A6A7A3Z9_9PLEO|nr:hypothetical protein CC86DRAFT_455059 [Ophiobolus disseminans]